jgi:hypothetical protein
MLGEAGEIPALSRNGYSPIPASCPEKGPKTLA